MGSNEIQAMDPEQRERFHREAEAQIEVFKYVKPAPTERPKKLEWLVKRPLMQVVVQVVRSGGENNLHYHTNSETTWMVLKGGARFVGVGEKVLADLGPGEGIHIPGGSRYKFLKTGEEDLEILQIVAVADVQEGQGERINLEAHREWMNDSSDLMNYEDK